MARKIAILEDNLDRQTAMQALLATHLPEYELFFSDEAEPFIAWLKPNLEELLFISLDHDLELKPTGDGRWYDPGTGRTVADYLASCTPTSPIIIHSTNRPAVVGMEELLTACGWNVDIVTPYGDLAWVGESWWPAVKRALTVERNG